MPIQNVRIVFLGLILGLSMMMGGCASQSASDGTSGGDSSTNSSAATAVPIPASSPLAKIEVGMTPTKVQAALGEPGRQRSYPTAKNFIPFYFGGDTYRTDWIYPNVGRVIFKNTGRFSATMDVVLVVHDPNQE